MRGGKRCSAHGTTVWLLPSPTNTSGNKPWTTVNAIPVPIESVKVGDRIIGLKFSRNRITQTPTLVTHRNDFSETGYRLTTKRGYSTVATHDHPVWCCPPIKPREFHNAVDPDPKLGQWRHVTDIPAGWYVRIGFGPYSQGDIESDDDAYFRGLMDGDGNTTRPYGVMRYTAHEDETDLMDFVECYVRDNGVDGTVARYQKQDSRGVSVEWCNIGFKQWFMDQEVVPTAPVMKGYIQGLMDSDGCFTSEGKIVFAQRDMTVVRQMQQWLLLFGVKSSVRVIPANLANKRPNPIGWLQISGASVTAYVRQIGFRHKEKQRKAADFGKSTELQGRFFWDRVRTVDPVSTTQFVGLTTDSETYLADGIYSHNSGKTISAFALFASTVTGIPILGQDDKPVKTNMPQAYEGMIAWLIGWDLKHIGQTLYRSAFEPGLFEVIWDDKLNRYRVWNMANPEDKARESEKEPAEPLIPARLIDPDSWSFVKAGERQFSSVRLKNGVKIFAFPSTARQGKQGDPVDVVLIDEDVAYASHVKEYQDRLPTRGGTLLWSVWPHSSNEALVRMSARAEEQRDWTNPRVHETVIRFSDNPFVPEEEKKNAWDRMGTEEERRSRDFGEFMFDLVRMYDFDRARHCILDLSDERQKMIGGSQEDFWNRYYTEHKCFPRSWTRYLAIDPSHTRTACIVGVVPPPTIRLAGNMEYQAGDFLIIERELVFLRSSAEEVARQLYQKVGDYRFEAFIMDWHMGRTTAVGFGETIKHKYAEEFEKQNFRSRLTQNSFIDGMDETYARREFVRERLKPVGGAAPTMRVIYENCPETLNEFVNFKKRIVDGPEGREIRDEAARPRLYDCMAALEYLVSYSGLHYVDPAEYTSTGSPAYKRAQQILAKMQKNQDFVHFGPAAQPTGAIYGQRAG